MVTDGPGDVITGSGEAVRAGGEKGDGRRGCGLGSTGGGSEVVVVVVGGREGERQCPQSR